MASNDFAVASASDPDAALRAVSAATDIAFQQLAERGWHVAKLVVSANDLGLEADQPTVTVLRSTLMKPEHAGIVDEFAGVLAALDLGV